MNITISDIKLEQDARVVLENIGKICVDCANQTSPQKVVDFMEMAFEVSMKAEEFIYLICLTTKGKIINVFEVSHGTGNSSLVGIREIMMRALLSGAAAIILVHNHPSGDPSPSKQDSITTQKLREASDLLGIIFWDHIIIGNNSYYSFAEVHKK